MDQFHISEAELVTRLFRVETDATLSYFQHFQKWLDSADETALPAGLAQLVSSSELDKAEKELEQGEAGAALLQDGTGRPPVVVAFEQALKEYQAGSGTEIQASKLVFFSRAWLALTAVVGVGPSKVQPAVGPLITYEVKDGVKKIEARHYFFQFKLQIISNIKLNAIYWSFDQVLQIGLRVELPYADASIGVGGSDGLSGNIADCFTGAVAMLDFSVSLDYLKQKLSDIFSEAFNFGGEVKKTIDFWVDWKWDFKNKKLKELTVFLGTSVIVDFQVALPLLGDAGFKLQIKEKNTDRLRHRKFGVLQKRIPQVGRKSK